MSSNGEVTLVLTREECEAFITDSRRLDAYVLARSGGGIAPSKLRAETRRKIAEALRDE